MSQNRTILAHLSVNQPITATQAFSMYGVARLAARIADLRERGFNIKTDMVTAKNRFNKTVTFASYTLIEND